MKALLAALSLSVCFGIAVPAVAANDAPMKKKSAKHWTCYDYAWESQDMKDCLAKPQAGSTDMSKGTMKKKASTKKMG